jgi:uncharacterized membrane protein YcaP (DUF421 family)
VNGVVRDLIDSHDIVGTAAKTSALFLTAAVVLRFTERRTLAEFAPFDWVAGVAAGAIVGRSATATDTSWLTATAGLVCLLLTHAVVARLRFVPILRKLIDPPLQVLIRDGAIDLRNVRRCGLTKTDMDAVLRQHGLLRTDDVHLAIFEAKGVISVVPAEARPARGSDHVDGLRPSALRSPDPEPAAVRQAT